jgi:hypothetical protein
MSARTSIDTPEGMGLPSIQSGGLALARDRRANRLNRRFQQSASTNQDLLNGLDVAFYAEDLLRGYRVDIRDDASGAWRSLCQRIGSYVFPEAPLDPLPFEDEGYLKGASTTSKDDQNSDLYFHETLFRWGGWSLVAERPGKTIQRKLDADSGEYQESPERVKSQAGDEFKLEVRASGQTRQPAAPALWAHLPDAGASRRPGGQQRRFQRPGRQSRQRAGAVPALRAAGPPALVPRARFTEGESVERMVIRSNYHQTAGEYVGDPAGGRHAGQALHLPGSQRAACCAAQDLAGDGRDARHAGPLLCARAVPGRV